MSRYQTLAQKYPEIAADWHPTRNGKVTPAAVFSSSRRAYWWRCPVGHEYCVSVSTRIRTLGCKFCTRPKKNENVRRGRLAGSTTLEKASATLALEWVREKNLPLAPDTVSKNTHRKFWWRCSAGHEWQASVKARIGGTGCPVCYAQQRGEKFRAAKLRLGGTSFSDAHPDLLSEWDWQRNTFDPSKLSPKSNVRARWVCKFGHRWTATITNRTNNGSGCPYCVNQTSRLEIFLLCEARAIFGNVLWRARLRGFECDLFVPALQLAIEVDGEYWHRLRPDREQRKSASLAEQGITLIRVRHESLPHAEGLLVPFSRSDAPIDIAVRLFRLINSLHASEALDAYIAGDQQIALARYKKMLSHLPAPPQGETLMDRFPEVAAQWDFAGNEPLTPQLFSSGSEQKVGWICGMGHRWQATIKNRTMRHSGCPVCARAGSSERMKAIRRQKYWTSRAKR